MNILLVSQDSNDAQQMLHEHLNALGSDAILLAEQPLRTFNRASTATQPDGIIIDTALQEEQARTLVDAIKMRNPGVPLMVIHFQENIAPQKQGSQLSEFFTQENGADIYIPFFATPDSMRSAVQSLLEKAKVQRQHIESHRELNTSQKLSSDHASAQPQSKIIGTYEPIRCGEILFLPDVGRVYFLDRTKKVKPQEEFDDKRTDDFVGDIDPAEEFDLSQRGQHLNQYRFAELDPNEVRMIQVLHHYRSDFTPTKFARENFYLDGSQTTTPYIERTVEGIQNKIGDLLASKAGLSQEEKANQKLAGPLQYIYGTRRRGFMLNQDPDEIHPSALIKMRSIEDLFEHMNAMPSAQSPE